MKCAIRYGLLAMLGMTMNAFGAITVFQNDLAGFDAAAGTPGIAIDFDAITAGTNIAGNTISGVTFSNSFGNSLEVVAGAATSTPDGFSNAPNPSTNTLIPTSGANVLSPGGVVLVPGSDIAEEDGLTLDFSAPVNAFGVDVLFQSLDFSSFTSFQILDMSSAVVSSGSVDTGAVGGAGGSPGGTFFIGFVSDDPGTDIARIVFLETDGTADFPDSNIGYDTLRFHPVPLPFSLLFFGSGCGALIGLRSRRISSAPIRKRD